VPITNVFEDLTVVLTRVDASRGELQFSLSSPDWRLPECRIIDEEGNSHSWTKMARSSSSMEFTAEFRYLLEPNRNWKVEAKFVQTTNITAQSTFTAELSPGPEVVLTNSPGAAYIARFDGQQLYVRRTNSLERPYLELLAPTNSPSYDPLGPWTTGWMRDSAGEWQIWQIGSGNSNPVVKLAVPRIVKAEFYFQPGATNAGQANRAE
jgi:hypothetical protein